MYVERTEIIFRDEDNDHVDVSATAKGSVQQKTDTPTDRCMRHGAPACRLARSSMRLEGRREAWPVSQPVSSAVGSTAADGRRGSSLASCSTSMSAAAGQPVAYLSERRHSSSVDVARRCLPAVRPTQRSSAVVCVRAARRVVASVYGQPSEHGRRRRSTVE